MEPQRYSLIDLWEGFATRYGIKISKYSMFDENRLQVEADLSDFRATFDSDEEIVSAFSDRGLRRVEYVPHEETATVWLLIESS